MKKTTLLMILSLLVAALYGCGTGKDNVTTAATDESVTEKKEENAEEKVTEQQENTEEQKEENIEESSNKSQEELHQEIDALKQEKEMFLEADKLGRDLYWGMVYGDVETLKPLFSDNFQVYNNKIVKEENGKTYETPLDNFQTEGYKNHKATFEIGTFFLHEEESLYIIYDIYPPSDEALFHLNVKFVKDESGALKIGSIAFDA
jgi:hypothetical protein